MSTVEKPTIRVMLADDQGLIRDGLRYLIDDQKDMQVIGEAENGEAAVEAALATQPDVVLMDIQMPGGDGLTATRQIVRALPGVKVLLLTTFDDSEYVYDGIRAGAIGYLLKDAETAELIDSIRAAYRGQALYRTDAAAEALSRVVQTSQDEYRMDHVVSPSENKIIKAGKEAELLLGELTYRELEVLQEMARGLRNDEIARNLFVTEGTVKTHVHRILQKFGVDDRTQAVILALRRGIVN